MTEQLERELATGFHEYAAGLRLDPGVLAAAAARHHRRAVARRTMVAGGVVAVAAAMSAVLALNDTAPPAHRPPAAQAGAPAPALRLAAAAQATAQTSFRLRITLTRSYDTGRLKGYREENEYSGAFDAAADRGYLRFGRTPVELRIIGADIYLGTRHLPRRELGDLLGGATPAASATLTDPSVDPRVLLDTLRHLGSVTPGAGSAGVDRYTFAYPVAADASTAAHRVTGAVEMAAGSHLVSRITQQTTTVGADPAVADRQPLTWRTVIEFSDYGIPVRVGKPN